MAITPAGSGSSSRSAETESHREKVLAARAEALAQRGDGERRRGLAYDIALIRLAEETFGIPVTALRECVALPHIARLPGLPTWFLGVCQIRGEFMSVVDMGRYLGLDARESPATLVVLQAPQGPVGMAAERLLGFRGVYEDELAEAPDQSSDQSTYVLAVTRDLVTILDPQRIVADERLLVRRR